MPIKSLDEPVMPETPKKRRRCNGRQPSRALQTQDAAED